MKVTVKRQAITEALDAVRRAVPTKTNLPVLVNVRLRADGKYLVLAGTDLETGVISRCLAKVEAKGEALVPVKMLDDFLKNTDTPVIQVESKGKVEHYTHYEPGHMDAGKWIEGPTEDRTRKKAVVMLLAGAASVTIGAPNPKDFPPLEEMDKFDASAKFSNLTEALGKVVYAVDDGRNGRPYLEGVFLKRNGSKVDAVACDGFRMAVAETRCRGDFDSVILPPRTVAMVQRLFSGPVTMHVGATKMTDGKKTPTRAEFTDGKGTAVVSSLIQANYPDYKQLLPKGGTACTVKTAEFRKAVQAVFKLSGAAHVDLTTRGTKLLVETTPDDTRTFKVEIPAKGRIRSAFNPAFLIAVCDQVGDTMALRAITNSEGRVTQTYVKDGNAIHVMMPLVRPLAKKLEPEDLATHMEPVSSATPAVTEADGRKLQPWGPHESALQDECIKLADARVKELAGAPA